MPTTEHVTTPVYQPGDTDPTIKDVNTPCLARRGSYGCTWNAGHTHPQHVAGTADYRVAAVWPVAP